MTLYAVKTVAPSRAPQGFRVRVVCWIKGVTREQIENSPGFKQDTLRGFMPMILEVNEDEYAEILPGKWNGHTQTRMFGDCWVMEATNIGEVFAYYLRAELSDDEMASVRARNATAEYAGCCASHDHLDANEVMLTAFAEIMGRGPDPLRGAQADADEALWNAAWDYARAKYLIA